MSLVLGCHTCRRLFAPCSLRGPNGIPALRAPFCSCLREEPSIGAGDPSILNRKRASSVRSLRQAKLLHARVVEYGDENCQTLQDAILRTYVQYGALDDASTLFACSNHRCATTWACIIAGQTDSSAALGLLQQMFTEGFILDKPILTSILSFFSDPACIADVKRMHTRIKNSTFCSEIVIATILICVYSNCLRFDCSKRVFGCILERDAVMWVVIIRAYLQAGQCEVVFHLFQQIMMEGILPNEFVYASVLAACYTKSRLKRGQAVHCHIWWSEYRFDSVICNALVTMYGKCGTLEDARAAFDDSDDQDKVTWNAIIGACAQHNQGKDAVLYVQQMQERGFVTDDLTLMSALDACANQSALTDGKKLHQQLLSVGLRIDVNVSNALLNMYGRCGSLLQARAVFDGMLHRNVITWTSMIAAYAQHGLAEDALDVLSKMVGEGGIPNSITFVNILSACGHSGLVKEGYKQFASMVQNHTTPTIEHYNCLLDLLGRAGRLDEGELLLKHLPVESTLALWTTLLSGCSLHFDIERGDYAASQALYFDSQESGPYILLRNMLIAISQDECRTLRDTDDTQKLEINGCRFSLPA